MIKSFLNKLSINKAAKIIHGSKKTFVLTGAGISAAAGIPTFRGTNGLWEQKELEFLTDPLSWKLYPHKCWIEYERYRLLANRAKPTSSHHAIKALQDVQRVTVATTNVDSLHFRCGSQVYEMHGCLDELRCIGCKKVIEMPSHPLLTYPTCKCTAWMRHDVVLFGEQVRYSDKVDLAIDEADTIVFVGTSGKTTDIGEIARHARKNNKTVIEINPAKATPATPYANIHLRLSSDAALPQIVQRIYKLRTQK